MSMIAEYVAHRVRMGEYTDRTAGQVSRVLHQWHRHAGDEPRAWTTDQMVDWVHDQTLRPNSRKVRRARLRCYCAWLLDHGHLDVDPTRGLPSVHIPKPNPRDLTVEQVRRLIGACPDERAVLIVVLMIQCGLRAGDLARVRIEDIDANRRALHVRAKGGRGEPTHWVPIPAEAWQLVAAQITRVGRGAGPLVEQQRRPGVALAASRVTQLLQIWIAAAGLKSFPYDGVSAHALRHSCAQHLIDDGADIRQVQAVLGHASVTTTELYLRRDPPGLREAMEGRHYLDAA